jgi:Fic family protein
LQSLWPLFVYRQGALIGQMKGLGFRLRQEAVLETLTKDVLKTSEIEGEKLDAEQVRSSVARRLGMDIGGLKPADRNVEGVVEMMLDATGRYDRPLTDERLFGWHAALFPTGRSGMTKDQTGAWRDEAPGRCRSSPAPWARRRAFRSAESGPPRKRDDRIPQVVRGQRRDRSVLKAGLAHLWFVTIHPFEDGNGRIARAIADMALARSEQSSQRFYSMSAQIKQEHKSITTSWNSTQKGTMDVTPGCSGSWTAWAAPSTARMSL